MPPKKKVNSEIGRTSIDIKVVLKLWAVSGGRCELCNRLLYSDLTFGADGNFGEMAHIHAVSAGGPRHKVGMTPEEKNNIENLMLLCEEHHHMIDSNPDEYGDSFLVAQKRRHEQRIRSVTDIGDNQSCRMVSYFSNIDNQEVFNSERLFKDAVLSAGLLPLQQPVIALNADSHIKYEPSKESIASKAYDLDIQFKSWFDTVIKSGDSIAAFALAPQPLLFKLGTLLNDQYNVKAFQCHRNGHKWAWKDDTSSVNFNFVQSKSGGTDGVALVIDLSAQVLDDRIEAVIDDDCSIFHLTMADPNRMFVTNERIQDDFVKAFRCAMEAIKNIRPAPKIINLFPVMPNSLVIRAGMDYMPKTDLPLKIFEQGKAEQGFFETITIGG